MFGPLRCGEMYALDRLLREARVLEIIRRMAENNPQSRRQPTEGKVLFLVLGHLLHARLKYTNSKRASSSHNTVQLKYLTNSSKKSFLYVNPNPKGKTNTALHTVVVKQML